MLGLGVGGLQGIREGMGWVGSGGWVPLVTCKLGWVS